MQHPSNADNPSQPASAVSMPDRAGPGIATLRGRLAYAVLGALSLFPGLIYAQEGLPGWQAALMSGSDRLALYSAAQAKIPDVIPALVHRTGGLHRGTSPNVIARDIHARPILYYSSNFNGGIPGEQITIGGLDFTIDEASRAKSGLVAGASVSGGVLASYRQGSLLRLSFGSSAEWLSRENLRRQQLQVSGCVQHHLGGWSWLDGCIGAVRVWRSYDTHVTQQNVSLGPTMISTIKGIDQQISLRATRVFHEDGPQNGLEAKWIGAIPEWGALRIGLEWAAKLKRENTPLRGLSLGLTRPVADRPVEVSFGYTETGGAQLAGREREDRIVTLGLSAPLTEKLGLSASIGHRISTIDTYEETFGQFSIDLRKW